MLCVKYPPNVDLVSFILKAVLIHRVYVYICCYICPKRCMGIREYQYMLFCSWWRHQMETFPALLAVCEGNPSPVTGGFPSQRPVARNFNAFVDQRINKRLNKQYRSRWVKTPSRSLWRHCNYTFFYFFTLKVFWWSGEASFISATNPLKRGHSLKT